MLDMLGADKRSNDPKALAAQVMKDLDSTHDGKVSKGKIDLLLNLFYFFLFIKLFYFR